MSLTIPRAGTSAGRSATIRVEADQIGAKIAQFGEIMAAKGLALENDRLQREANRLNLDLTHDMNQLRLEFEQIGDPDAVDTLWPGRINDLRQSYMTGATEDGRARVDPKNVERFGLAFDELAERHGFSLATRGLAQRQAQRAATLIEYSHEAITTGAGTDPDTRDTLAATYEGQVDQMVANGAINAAQAAEMKIDFRTKMDNAAVILQIADDPQGFLDMASDGEYNGLGGETLSRYQVQAQNVLDRQQADATKDAERAQSDRAKEVDGRLREMTNIFQARREPTDMVWLDSDEAKASPEYPEAMAAYSLMLQEPQLAQMTPDQLAAMITGEKNTSVDQEYQTERLKVLERLQADAVEGYATDPVEFRAQTGQPYIELPGWDAPPEELANVVAMRVQHGANLQSEGYTDTLRVFTNTELESLRAATGPDADPAKRVAATRALTAGLSEAGGAEMLARLSGDPVTGHVAGLLQSGGTPALAQDIFRGQQEIAAGNISIPAMNETAPVLYKGLRNIFAGSPNGAAQMNSLRTATEALYAARLRGSKPLDDIDEDIYRQALHEAAGGTGTYDDANLARGGIQEVRDTMTILQPGITAREVENTLNSLQDLLSSSRPAVDGNGRFVPVAATDEQRFSAFINASTNGTRPAFGANAIDRFETLTLQAIPGASDAYIFSYVQNGRTWYIQDEAGSTFTFSLRRIIAEAAR